MRRYLMTGAIMAVLIGALFQGAEQTGIKLFNMAATIGVLLFGIVGTIAITRHQNRTGLKEIETVLKSLEPECLITDWAYQGNGRPDYLVVAPGGVVAITLDNVAQSSFRKFAANQVARGRERALASVRWLRDRMNEAGPGLKEPLSHLVQEMPVEPVLLLVRRRAAAEYSADGVTVLNAEQLAEHVRSLSDRHLLEEPARIKLTRLFRSA